MDLKKSKRLIWILAAIYWVFAIGIYGIAQEQFHYSMQVSDAPEGSYVIGQIVDGMELRQEMEVTSDAVTALEIYTGTYNRDNAGTMTLKLTNAAGTAVAEKTVDLSDVLNDQYTRLELGEELPVQKNEVLTLTLTTQGCSEDNAITLYAGNSEKLSVYELNGEAATGTLCVRFSGYNQLNFYWIYWILVVAAFALLAVYTYYCWYHAIRGKSNPLVSLCTVYSRYSFLLKQLVMRDFKTKYKRSALGMAWSFVNPLLTMMVQYIVFSTLFNSNIHNYPVYLLTGIVFFTFFNECLSLGMTSITSNASLIKKVYMPKYIYPVSRILSSLINFAFALMPLFLVIILTGTRITPAIFLLLFDIVCLLGFVIGMTLLLTTAMTFFQDTQFLWSVVSMMWQYVTPIFYPETIIPAPLLPIYRLNPMYQFITFARTCIIQGISPAPQAYFNCLITSAAVLLLGIAVFKKHQNKFVLYL